MAVWVNFDTDDQTDQVVKLSLDSTLYIGRLRYTDRGGWRLSLYDYYSYDKSSDDNSDSLLYGERRLMPMQDFLKYAHGVSTLPSGALYCYDTTEPTPENVTYPTRYNLGQGKQFQLLYFTESESEEI